MCFPFGGFFLAFLLLVILSPLTSQISVNLPPSLPLYLPPGSLGTSGSWEGSEGTPLFHSSCSCHSSWPPISGPDHHQSFPITASSRLPSSPFLTRGTTFFRLTAELLSASLHSSPERSKTWGLGVLAH